MGVTRPEPASTEGGADGRNPTRTLPHEGGRRDMKDR